jgi:hypothetical protein
MKFFTLDWWCGLQQFENYDPVPGFQKHLRTIRDKLPQELLDLQETVSLHDANLRFLQYEQEHNTLQLQLDGDDGSGGLRHFVLRYLDVSVFRTLADPKIGLPGPHGYGDLGYDEADITSDGKLEH